MTNLLPRMDDENRSTSSPEKNIPVYPIMRVFVDTIPGKKAYVLYANIFHRCFTIQQTGLYIFPFSMKYVKKVQGAPRC